MASFNVAVSGSRACMQASEIRILGEGVVNACFGRKKEMNLLENNPVVNVRNDNSRGRR